MIRYLHVKHWHQFQHYGKRCPPWIKLHRSVLDDYSFCSLPDNAKAHLMVLWLHASSHDGKVPNDTPFLEKKLSITGLDLALFVERGFLLEFPDKETSE